MGRPTRIRSVAACYYALALTSVSGGGGTQGRPEGPNDPNPPRQSTSDPIVVPMIRAIAALVLALAAQYLFVSIDVGAQLRTLFASIAEALVLEPPSRRGARRSRRMSERSTGSSRRAPSASLLWSTALMRRRHSQTRFARPHDNIIEADLAMRCGERLRPSLCG